MFNQKGSLRLILVSLAQALITAYQKYLRPVLPAVCRYEPGCSEYLKQAILKYGIIKGGFKGITRICRCHPFCNRPSYDPLV